MPTNDAVHETESLLSVGLPTILVTAIHRQDALKTMTAIRGWRTNKFILIDRPRDREGVEAIVAVGTPCKVRLINDGLACEFQTTVLDIDTGTRNGEVRLKWPKGVRRTAFRKYERIAVQISCDVHLNGEATCSGHMRDVSVGGFSLQTRDLIPEDTELQLSFTLPDGGFIEKADAYVRSCQTTENGFLVGCQFKGNQAIVENEVAYFVSTWLRHFRSQDADAIPPRILVLDPGDGPACRVRGAFHDQGIETILATNFVDATYRIRMLHPVAALACEEQLPIDATTFINLLYGSPTPYRIPFYLCKNGSVRKFAEQTGAAIETPFSTTTEDTDAMVSAILSDLKVLTEPAKT